MTRPWATKCNVKVGLALRSCQVTFQGFFQPTQFYISKARPASLPHFKSIVFLPLPLRCSKETHAVFWRIQGTADTANFWSTKSLQTLDQNRYCPFWKKDPLIKSLYLLLNKVAFYFSLFLFFQMLKRSKGQISSLSLLQHCSSNRNRNCWRPEKSDLKRFRGGETTLAFTGRVVLL